MFQEFPTGSAAFETGCGQFRVIFPNGIEVSAINHDRAYCSDRGDRRPRSDRPTIPEYAVYATSDVEVGIFHKDDNSRFFAHDQVTGHVTGHVSPDEYARILAYIATCPQVKYWGDLKRFGATFAEAEAVAKMLRDERAARA